MADFQILSVENGAEVVFAEANRFKTNEISLSFFTDLDEKTASANAVAVMLLSRSTRKYPSILKLNSKLASLYGAQLEAGVAKAGELQMLKIGITSLDNFLWVVPSAFNFDEIPPVDFSFFCSAHQAKLFCHIYCD